MATLYEMAQGPAFPDLFESFRAGKQARYDQRMNENKLAELARMEQARPLVGKALLGDKNALAGLAGLDNQSYMDVKKLQSDQADSERSARQAEYERIAGVLQSATTPELWDRAIRFLESQGADITPEERNFANRDFVIAQGAKEAEKLGLTPIYGVDADGNTVAALPTRSGGLKVLNQPGFTPVNPRQPQEGKRRTQITEVDGRRKLVDLDSGETVQDLGAAPVRGRPGPTSTELKARYEAEDNNAVLDTSLQTLDEASALLGTEDGPGQVLEGYGAGIRGDISSKAPGVADFLGIASPEQGKATAEFGRIMNAEAIKQMSEQLKGATTDRELQVFVNNLADPSVPNSIKRKTIIRMKALLKRKRDLNATRIDEIRGSRDAAPQPDTGGGQGWNEQDLPSIIQDAQDAIQQGADPEAVIQDMIDNGVNPDYARTLLNGQ